MILLRRTLITSLLALASTRAFATLMMTGLGSSGGSPPPPGDGIISEASVQIDSEAGVDIIAES